MVEVFEDQKALSEAAAELFTVRAEEAVDTEGRFSVALSGGSTPRAMFALLAQPPFRDSVPWENTHVFWGDERLVPADHPMSNYRAAREALLDHVPIPARQVHPIVAAPTPDQAAAAYEAVLKSYFGGGPPRFDLLLLGMGDDGHTASLFPGTPVLSEQDKWVAWLQKDGDPFFRATMTAPLLNEAAMAVFLVSGASKAATIRAVLNGPRDPNRLPAQLIRTVSGELLWLLDEAAASQLGE
jgi:6-phosphogluconolactonase